MEGAVEANFERSRGEGTRIKQVGTRGEGVPNFGHFANNNN